MALIGQAIALGTIVEVDFDGDDVGATPTYVAVGLIKGLTPPGQEGSEADGKILGDTLEQFIPGIEVNPIFNFTQYWHPGEAEQVKFDLAFDNRRKPAGVGGGVVTVRLLYPHDGVDIGDAMPTQAFLTNVLSIGKDTLDEPNSVYMRNIEMRRIGPIVPGTFTVV